jgi:hypothetical protein
MNAEVKSIVKSYPPVRLYGDDIRKLHASLRKVCAVVTIKAGNHSFKDIRRLKTLDHRKLHDLVLEGQYPYILLAFQKHRALLFILDESPFTADIISEIEGVVGKRYKKLARFFTNYIVTVLTYFVLIALGILAWKFTEGYFQIGSIGCILLLYAALSIFNYKMEKIYSTIVLK